MKRLLSVLLAATCVVASTPSLARGGGGHGRGGGGFFRSQGLLLGPSPQAAPAFQSRIPSPLPAPSQPPVINGPLSQPAFRGLAGIGE
jgi:hypothetical protein